MSRIVKFPVYFEVCGYQTMELPDDLNTDDENAVMEYISDHWDDVKLPEDAKYVSDNGFDFESIIEIIDTERICLEKKIKNYLYNRQDLVPEFLGLYEVATYGGKRDFCEMLSLYLPDISSVYIESFLNKHYRKHRKGGAGKVKGSLECT